MKRRHRAPRYNRIDSCRPRTLDPARGLLVWIFLLPLFAGCGRPAPEAEEQTVVPVEVVEVLPEPLRETSVITGVLEAYRGLLTDLVVDDADRADTRPSGVRVHATDTRIAEPERAVRFARWLLEAL